MLSQIEKIKKIAAGLPQSSGVYFFLDKKKKPIYVGRATNLRDRVRSYFARDLKETRGPLVAGMVLKVAGLKHIATTSLLEAIILEASAIKKYEPKYNTKEKDQKSFNYILVTKEDYPRVLVERARKLLDAPRGDIYGPFPKGELLKKALGIIRQIFPFRDKCAPNSGRPCFNRQIGLCPGVCSGEITKEEYQKEIRRLKMFLSGKMKNLIKELEKEMKMFAREREFEKAAEVKKKIFSLKHIQDVALMTKSDFVSSEKSPTQFWSEGKFRIEAIDVAHLSGLAPVGVVVVVLNGKTEKSNYRKFILRATPAGDDLAGLREVLSRRLRHFEWPLPDLLVLDGGGNQLAAAARVLAENRIKIPLVAVVKDTHHKPKKILGPRSLVFGHENQILLANAEAHRYAQSFHRARRDRAFREFGNKVK